MRILIIINACLMIWLYSCKGQESPALQPSGSKISFKLDSFIRDNTVVSFKKANAPGILVGVLHNGSRRFYTTGFADAGLKTVFDSSTVFETGSITKTFTAYLLMHVLEEKKISDSSSIINYLPDSVKQNRALEKISFLQLLNHSSGLPRLPDDVFFVSENPLQPYENYNKEKLFAYLKRSTPQPDGNSHYSNLGFGLAGVLAELISGKTYSQLLKEYISGPFELQNTGIEIPQRTNIATGMFDNTKAEYWKMDAFAGAGAVKSTASDILNYLDRISISHTPDKQTLIDKLTTATITISPQIRVCRGWHTIEDKGKPVIYWHNGGTYSFSTFAAFIKNDYKAVVVVINAFDKNNVSDALGISIIKQMLQ